MKGSRASLVFFRVDSVLKVICNVESGNVETKTILLMSINVYHEDSMIRTVP